MRKILNITFFFFLYCLLNLMCPTYVLSLEQTGSQAGKDAGRLFNNNYKSEGSIDTKLNKPLTEVTPLSTLDNSKSGDATTFCGTGAVQNEKIALQVRVYQSGTTYYITTYSDTNDDGVLDSTRNFVVSQVCLGGYKNGSAYYKWTVTSSGYVSTTASTALDGCMDPLVNPPTYCGGALSQAYADATGKSITNSSFTGDTATYYAGQVKDCNNNTKDIAATKYYDNPYKINDAAIATVTSCSSNDPACQAYQGTQSSSLNVSTSSTGTFTCTVTRNIINAQGPQNGIICESNKIYYANSFANGICYKTSGSTWDYNSGFKARCDSFGKNLTLEGWASWEGAPCGQNANWPPQPQISYPLVYGGNASSMQIGALSTNRRMCGSNCAYNDQGSDTRCVTDVTPITVNLSRACNTNNASCNYNISVNNAPACPSYVIVVSAPVGENIDNQCATYEEQNCNVVDEWWYTSTGTSVQTIRNGAPSNTYPAVTCKTFSALGSVCKEWWRKSRTYKCGSTNKFSPDISRATKVMDSADSTGTSTVTYEKSAFNKEHTSNCIKQIDYDYPFTTIDSCTSMGGVVRCPPGFTMSGDMCISSPVCPAESRFNAASDYCEMPVVPQCLDLGFVYNSVSQMCESDPTCTAGTFNQSTDRCESTPVPTCSSGFNYNSSTQMCEAQGHCEEGNYNSSTHLCEVPPVPSCRDSFTYNPTTNKCEMNPPCTRGTYNPSTKECEYTPQPSCPNNYDYNPSSQKCETNPICLMGTYNPTTKYCEYVPSPQCPPDFTFNSENQKCQNNPECLMSATYDVTNDVCYYNPIAQCPTGYSFSTVRNQCEADPYCSSGTYNTSRDYCEKNRINSCPPDYTYNSNYKVCQVDPPCPSPGTYTTAYNLCQTPESNECPDGMTYNATRSRCESNPTCPSPYLYVPGRNRCEKSADHACDTGFTYNSSRAQCEMAATCPAPSTLNTSHNQCEEAPVTQCDPGYNYSAGNDKCQQDPICNFPSTYSTARNRCEKPYENICDSGFTYIPSADQCQMPPPCESPSIYDPVDNRCEKNPDNYCDPTYTFDGSSTCYQEPPCDPGSTYNTGTNRCEVAATTLYTCPSDGSYPDPTDCLNNCPTTGACSNKSATLIVSSSATLSIDSFTASASTITFNSGATTVGTVTSTSGNLSFSGSSTGSFNKIQCTGTEIQFYDGATLRGTLSLTQGQCTATTVTCSNYADRIASYSSYGINFYSSGKTCGYIAFKSFICPGGSYPCDGIPGNCTYNQTCTSSYSCPTGFTLSGSLCYKSVACPYSGTLNTSTDQCVKAVLRCQGTGFTYNSSQNVCYKSVTCLSGSSLNISTDVCYKAPTRCDTGYSIDSLNSLCYASATCPSPSTLNTGTDKCEIDPTRCINGFSYNAKYNICQLSPVCTSGATYDTSYHICKKPDTDCLDGTYYSSADVCYQSVVCPWSSTLDTGNDVCYKSSTIICPPNYAYNASYGLCTVSVACPSGGTLQTTRDKCEISSALVCDDDFTWNSTYNMCQKSPICSDGILDAAIDKCKTSATYTCTNPFIFANNRCEDAPVCYSGSLLNGTTDKCEIDPTYDCANQYVFDTVTHSCRKAPDCYSPGSINTSVDKCQADSFYYCDSGFILDPSIPFCHMPPPCPSQSVLNASTDKCEDEMFYSCHMPEYTFNSTSGLCEGNPDCTTGIFNTSSHMCELDPNFCPGNLVFDRPAWLCYNSPTCTNGTYNASISKCETDPRFCPSNFEYNAADFICRADPSCTPGAFDPSTDKCNSDPKCEKTEYKEFSCVYDNPADNTGLHCDDSSFTVQQYEVKRQTLRDCIESTQCQIACVVSVPDGSGGYDNEQRACTDDGNDIYTCPNGTYSIVRQCGCIINTFDGNDLKESDCTVSCMVVSPNSNPGGNVTNDYIIKECIQTIVDNSFSYRCPLVGSEYIYQDCGCIDTFGLSAGVMGALVEAIRDKECIP
jgi:hypothetical protein